VPLDLPQRHHSTAWDDWPGPVETSQISVLTHSLMTVDEDLLRMPANNDVISIIRNTAKVMPTISAVKMALSLTSSLNARRRMPFSDAADEGMPFSSSPVRCQVQQRDNAGNRSHHNDDAQAECDGVV
jgi:hypothetical protein